MIVNCNSFLFQVRYNAEPMSPPPPPPPGYSPPATTTTPAPISYYQPYTTTTTTTTPPPPIYQVIYPVPPKAPTTTTPAPVPYGPYVPPTTTASPATSIYGNLPPSQIPKVIYAIMMMDKMQAAASASPSARVRMVFRLLHEHSHIINTMSHVCVLLVTLTSKRNILTLEW